MKQKRQQSLTISSKKLSAYHKEYVQQLQLSTPETRGTYERSLREFFRWYPHDGKFRFRTDDVERYKKFLFSKRKLSPASVTTYITSLRRFCKFLVAKNVLKENPAKGVRWIPRSSQHTREILTQEEVKQVLLSVERADERGYRDYAVIKIMLVCGLSEIELVRANIEDVKISGNKVSFCFQSKGKKTKDTEIVLPYEVREAFLGYLSFRKDADGEEPLFMSAGNRTRGERMTTRGIRDRINMYLENSGVKQGRARRLTAFSLRHTAIAMMAESGASIEEIQSKFRIKKTETVMLYLKNK